MALAGAALVVGSQAQAQQSAYANQDLLLNFRNINSQTPPNVEIDLGNVNTFLASVAPGTTVNLDSGAASPSGLSAAQLLGAVGTPASGNPIGFSANAADSTSDTLWLTRVITGPDATGTDLTASAKQSASTQSATAQAVALIGAGYNGGTQAGSGNAATVPAGNGASYYSQTVDGTGTMDYKGAQSPAAGAGGALEGSQNGSGNVYEALWTVPPTVSRSNPGVPDTYDGYFTFQPNGEVDFTAAGNAVPEPSTIGLMVAGLGFVANMARRQRGAAKA